MLLLYLFLFKNSDRRSLLAYLIVFLPPLQNFSLATLPLFFLTYLQALSLYFIKIKFLFSNKNGRNLKKNEKSEDPNSSFEMSKIYKSKRKSYFESNQNMYINSSVYYFVRIRSIRKLSQRMLDYVRNHENIFVGCIFFGGIFLSVQLKLIAFLGFILLVKPILLMLEHYSIISSN